MKIIRSVVRYLYEFIFPVDPRLKKGELESFSDGCERMKKEIEMKGKMNNED